MFSSLTPNFRKYAAAFRAAQINTVEAGFYIPPNNSGYNYNSSSRWESDFDAYRAPAIEAAASDGFSIILTGDEIARGSDAVYDSVSGPSTLWNEDPITYAFTWAKNVGKVIGVEMVDEISSQFAVPFPEGQLGQPGGPQKITCVDDLCTVSWPSQPVVQNGAGKFLITGATSNPNLNRPVTDLYRQNSGFVLSSLNANQDGFTFNSRGVGTQTFTAQSDPDLTLEMFAAIGEGPNGTDYVHNDAIHRLMSYVDAVPGHPAVTWPAAALAPAANFGAWMASGASDYNDIYFTYLNNSAPTSFTLSDGLLAFNRAWNNKFPFVQKDKPTLMLAGDVGVGYKIAGTPVPVASFDGTTLTFSQPHGIDNPTVGLTRLSLSGNSNSALNGNYFVYKVLNSDAVQVYPAGGSGPTVLDFTVALSDGQVLKFTAGGAGILTAGGMQFRGAENCIDTDNFAQVATVSGASYAAYNGTWYVLPLSQQNHGNNGDNPCSWGLDMRLLAQGESGSGGSASLIMDNYYHPGVSTVTAPAVTPDLVAANIMYAAEKGAAGVRVYMFGDDANGSSDLSGCFTNCSNQDNANPFYNGAAAQARWQAMSNAFNLIHDIEPFLLQPRMPAPDYGPTMITGARTSSYGTLLMMTEFATTAQVVNVDLTAYNPSSSSGTMYIMSGEALSEQSVSGTSLQITFAPGETVAFTFPVVKQMPPGREPDAPARRRIPRP